MEHRGHGRHQPAVAGVPLDDGLHIQAGQQPVQIVRKAADQIHIGAQGTVAAVLILPALPGFHIRVEQEGHAHAVGANHIEVLHIVAGHQIRDEALDLIVALIHLAGLIVAIQLVGVQLAGQGAHQVRTQLVVVFHHGGAEGAVADHGRQKAQHHAHGHNQPGQLFPQRPAHFSFHPEHSPSSASCFPAIRLTTVTVSISLPCSNSTCSHVRRINSAACSAASPSV